MEFIETLKKKFKKIDYKAMYLSEKKRADSTEVRLEYLLSQMKETIKKADDEGAIEWAKNNNLF
jgi:hypothetical protein|tara:strand:- start:5975 stop:6166 length:192 start_codon:yes stop_codon:yes gene_type:complete